MTSPKHWSRVEHLHETVKNPNIHIRGTGSYYSDARSGSFEGASTAAARYDLEHA